MAVSRFFVPLCFVALCIFQIEALDIDVATLSKALNKLRTCPPETQLDLVSDFGRIDKWWPPHIDPEACINVTLDIANFERVGFSVFKLGLEVFNDSKTVGLEIFNCKSNLPDVFKLLECAITQLENSGPLVHAALENLKTIISDVNVSYDAIIVDVKKCIGLNKPSIIGEILHQIHHKC